MDLESIMPSEVRKTNTLYHLYVESKKYNKLVNITKKKQTHRYREQTRDFPGGPVAKTPCSQWRGPRFNPWSGNWIPRAATKSPHAATKDPACHN